MMPSSSERAPRPTLGAVFLLALAACLVLHFAATPVDWHDSAVYIADGNSLFADGLMSSSLYMPLYPILIHLCGTGGILWLQALISAATAVLAATLAQQIFSSRAAGIAAGVLAALHPLLIFYANMRLSETVFTFFEVAAFAALYGKRWWLGSAAFVLAILTRPALDLVAPLLVLSFCVVHRESADWRLVLRRLATYALVYVVLMTPWWVHNLHKYGSFVRLDLADGLVMRLENNPTFDEVGLDFGAFRSVLDFDDSKDPVALDEARKAAAYAYIAARPTHYLARSIERLGRFWTPLSGSAKPLVEAIAFTASSALYLGAVLCLARRSGSWRRLLPILVLILFLSAIHAATHALPRYRLPLEPFLAILAAGWYGPAFAALAARYGTRA